MKGFQKGREKTGGRQKGVTNKRVEALRDVLFTIASNHEDGGARLMKELNSLSGKEYIDAAMKIMEYCVPKLTRNEHTGADGETLGFKITMNLGNGDRV